MLLSTDPGGPPALPNVNDAQLFADYLRENLNQVRVIVLLQVLGLAFFLWFLASPWRTLREAEGPQFRGATAALAGGVTGTGLVPVGLALTATAGLSTSSLQAEVVPALYVASAISVALGMGVYSIFLWEGTSQSAVGSRSSLRRCAGGLDGPATARSAWSTLALKPMRPLDHTAAAAAVVA